MISAFDFSAVPCRNAVEAEQVKTFFWMMENRPNSPQCGHAEKCGFGFEFLPPVGVA
ncbi:MAG: hypothetical protein Q7V17_00785 [Afipia sp.]|nr:hypothetical protein [Afipia sp.]